MSGLARGIDGAAHRGASGGRRERRGRPPGRGRRQRRRRAVPEAERRAVEGGVRPGVLMSEWPPGTPPEAFRFPMRNRILAALCEVLVVVESRERGGSLLTVREALDRSVEVMAVPGSTAQPGCRRHERACSATAPRRSRPPTTCSASLGLDTRRQSAAPFDPRPALRGVDRRRGRAMPGGPTDARRGRSRAWISPSATRR